MPSSFYSNTSSYSKDMLIKNLIKYKASCPFLSSYSTSQLHVLSRKRLSFGNGSSRSILQLKAKECPVAAGFLTGSRSLSTFSSIQAKAFESKTGGCPVFHGQAFDYERLFELELFKKKKDDSYRYFNNINRLAFDYPKAITTQQEEVTVWCSNDYLGQSRNPIVCSAMKNAVDMFGTGAGGTRNIAGNSNSHLELEQELAMLHKKEAGLLFTSCYVANDATLSTLASKLPNCIIFSDELNHASMIQGIRNSRVNKKVFKHNDMQELESMLRMESIQTPKIIAFESVYSMNGSIGKIEEIVNLAKKYNALTFLDEVHAVGLYGKNGAGVAEHLEFNRKEKIMEQIDIISGTLGKAYGVVGGYIAGNRNLVDMIRSYAPGFIFTTSLPPPIVRAACQSVRYLKKSNFERQMQQINTKYVKQKLVEAGLPIIKNRSHIIPLLIGDAKMCRVASDMLLTNHKIYVQCINYPTVKKGEERLRITPCPGHTVKMANKLNESLKEIWNTLKLRYIADWESQNKQLKLETREQEIDSLWTSHQLSIIGRCRRDSIKEQPHSNIKLSVNSK